MISVQQRCQQKRSFLYSAVFCNPVLILHFTNAFLSLLRPQAIRDPIFNTWINPHLDVHAHDGLCQIFTGLMVVLQSSFYIALTSNTSEPHPIIREGNCEGG